MHLTERDYFQGITNYIARHELLLSAAATGKLSSGLPQNLQYLAIQTSVVPNFVRTFTTAFPWDKQGREIVSYDNLLVEDASRIDFLKAVDYRAQALAYVAYMDLQNIRDGVYPMPKEIQQARISPVQESGKTLQELMVGLSLYMGAPNYNFEQTTSDTLRELIDQAQENVSLPDYYQHDFHSVPGGFLNPRHVQCYDTISEVVFSGMHRLARRLVLRPIWEEVQRKTNRPNELMLLDIATGTGSFLLQIQEAMLSIQLHAIDLSPAMVAFASKTNLAKYQETPALKRAATKPPQIQVANMESMPYTGNRFDVVTETNTFHELPQGAIRNVAREIGRVLVPGGLFLHLDANQLVDDPGSVSGATVGFDGKFVEPYMQSWMYEIDLDEIMLDEAGLVPCVPPQTMYASTLRCYRKK